jgi:UDP-N-acetylmuramoyl-tripeptide--D-alanyl-D-alanine ligase
MVSFEEVKDFKTVINSDELSQHDIVVSTDTRNLGNANLFIAITGEKFNAMKFLDQVVQSNVEYVAYSTSSINDDLAKKYPQLKFIETNDSIKFMQELANRWSRNFKEKKGEVICISGSNGKTTTKEMLTHLLQESGLNVESTQKNNNNHIGVPLTLFQICAETQVIVVELGSNHPGEIQVVCDVAEPTYAYATNIGHTHLEFFDGLKGVFEEESYPYKSIHQSSYGKSFFKNIDDEFLNTLETTEKVIEFGSNQFSFNQNSVNVGDITLSNSNITGEHNFFNLAGAFLIAKTAFPELEEKFIKAATSFRPTSNRSEWIELSKTKIFLDAYNANPSSMKASLSGFASGIESKQKALVVIGEMYELGDDAAKLHSDVASFVNGMDFGQVVFIGALGQEFKNNCSDAKVYATAKDYKKDFENDLNNHDYVFIKGSRSLQLESLIDIT